jgi:hypothetical protein
MIYGIVDDVIALIKELMNSEVGLEVCCEVRDMFGGISDYDFYILFQMFVGIEAQLTKRN